MRLGESLKLRMYDVIWCDPYSSATLAIVDRVRIPVRDELVWPLNETTWTFFISNVGGPISGVNILFW